MNRKKELLKIFFLMFILIGSILFFVESVRGDGIVHCDDKMRSGVKRNIYVWSGNICCQQSCKLTGKDYVYSCDKVLNKFCSNPPKIPIKKKKQETNKNIPGGSGKDLYVTINGKCNDGKNEISYYYDFTNHKGQITDGKNTRYIQKGVEVKSDEEIEEGRCKINKDWDNDVNCKCFLDVWNREIQKDAAEKTSRVVEKGDCSDEGSYGCEIGNDNKQTGRICQCDNSKWTSCLKHDSCSGQTPKSSTDIQKECEKNCIANPNFADNMDGGSGTKAFLALIKGKEILPMVNAECGYLSDEKENSSYEIGYLIGKMLSGKMK